MPCISGQGTIRLNAAGRHNSHKDCKSAAVGAVTVRETYKHLPSWFLNHVISTPISI